MSDSFPKKLHSFLADKSLTILTDKILAGRSRSGRTAWLSTMVGLVFCFVLLPHAEAALIQIKGEEDFRKGFIISQDKQQVVFDELLEDGSTKRVTLSREKIDSMLVAVDPDRLSSLDPEQSKGYRNYADELAEKKIDPEAQAMAIRLYLIAADLDYEEHGRSALLGMISLARSAQEEKRFRALAFLLDPNNSADLMTSPKVDDASGESAANHELLEAIVQLRRGNNAIAARFANSKRGKLAFKKLENVLTHDEFLRAAKSSEPFSDAVLKKLVQAEGELESRLSDNSNDSKEEEVKMAEQSWSQVASKAERTIRFVSIETVTEFDPGSTVFRNDQWIQP